MIGARDIALFFKTWFQSHEASAMCACVCVCVRGGGARVCVCVSCSMHVCMCAARRAEVTHETVVLRNTSSGQDTLNPLSPPTPPHDAAQGLAPPRIAPWDRPATNNDTILTTARCLAPATHAEGRPANGTRRRLKGDRYGAMLKMTQKTPKLPRAPRLCFLLSPCTSRPLSRDVASLK